MARNLNNRVRWTVTLEALQRIRLDAKVETQKSDARQTETSSENCEVVNAVDALDAFKVEEVSSKRRATDEDSSQSIVTKWQKPIVLQYAAEPSSDILQQEHTSSSSSISTRSSTEGNSAGTNSDVCRIWLHQFTRLLGLVNVIHQRHTQKDCELEVDDGPGSLYECLYSGLLKWKTQYAELAKSIQLFPPPHAPHDPAAESSWTSAFPEELATASSIAASTQPSDIKEEHATTSSSEAQVSVVCCAIPDQRLLFIVLREIPYIMREGTFDAGIISQLLVLHQFREEEIRRIGLTPTIESSG